MGLLDCFSCSQVDSETRLEQLIDKFRKTRTFNTADLRVKGTSGLVIVTGHVALAPGVAALRSPITSKMCVYYKVIIDKKEKRLRTVHQTKGKKYTGKNKTAQQTGEEMTEEYYVWSHVSTDERKVDFQLVEDPNDAYTATLHVPLSSVPLRANAIRDVVNVPDATDKKVRRTEMSFHVGERVSIICHHSESGISAVAGDALDVDGARQWTRNDKKVWRDHVREPCFLVSDKPEEATVNSAKGGKAGSAYRSRSIVQVLEDPETPS